MAAHLEVEAAEPPRAACAPWRSGRAVALGLAGACAAVVVVVLGRQPVSKEPLSRAFLAPLPKAPLIPGYSPGRAPDVTLAAPSVVQPAAPEGFEWADDQLENDDEGLYKVEEQAKQKEMKKKMVKKDLLEAKQKQPANEMEKKEIFEGKQKKIEEKKKWKWIDGERKKQRDPDVQEKLFESPVDQAEDEDVTA